MVQIDKPLLASKQGSKKTVEVVLVEEVQG